MPGPQNIAGQRVDMTTTTALAINVPLMVLAFALITGIPQWLVFKHPDR